MNTFKRAVLGKLVDLGTAPVQVLEELKDQLQQADWVVKNERTSGDSLYIDVAPPNEEVGNDKGYERLRIQVDNDKIYFVPLLTGLYDVGPIYSIQNNASYSQSVIIDIGGKTYEITTPNANSEAGTRAIFEALKKVGHADYKFSLRMARGSLYVLAEGKNKGAPEVKVTKGYASVNKRGDAYTSGTTVAIPDARRQVTTDLANGFIYFLSVTDRTIGLATRTLTNQYGPIYAAFGDHASALEQTPPACVPVELFCVSIGIEQEGIKVREIGVIPRFSKRGYKPPSCRGRSSSVIPSDVIPYAHGRDAAFCESVQVTALVDQRSPAFERGVSSLRKGWLKRLSWLKSSLKRRQRNRARPTTSAW